MPRAKASKHAEGFTPGTVAFVSLGCPKNLVDSEKMLATLRDSGLRLVSEHDGAGAIVINTCGFLDASREESLEVIHEAIERKTKGRVGRVVVAGCLVQRHRVKMLEWAPGIDAMIGVFDRDRVVEAVLGEAPERTHPGDTPLPRFWIAANALQAAAERGRSVVGLTVNGADGNGIGYFEDDSNRFRLTPRHWAYLRVSEGCNQRCAFCTIPSIRGKMRSKPVDAILREARELFSQGCVELNLIGQDTTSYGHDIGDRGGLVGLLEALDREAASHGGAWIRLMYAYPSKFTDEMIDAFARLPNLLPYIDMPLQHASDRMLTAMRRQTTARAQRALLEKLRARVPGMAVRTTFITGFPGEREEDHRELLDFVREMRFEMMGVFRYSREDHTPAGTMDEDPGLHVPDEIKAQREEELMLAQQEIAFDRARTQAESRHQVEVLIDAAAPGRSRARRTSGVSRGGELYQGRTAFQAPTIDSVTWVMSAEPRSPGEIVRCTIVDADGYDLVAQPSEDLDRSVSLPLLGNRAGGKSRGRSGGGRKKSEDE
ncbi:MAG: 30S ribosomal protein S12 methylthiotransferase RimO [Phycisphaeraceae bacterium]|nr:30S ribosomal protein S12 methylthiotransferase RimO [Phycisphaeraceae bacterium]